MDLGRSWAPFGQDLGGSGRSFGHFWLLFGRFSGVLNYHFLNSGSEMGFKRPFASILEGSGRVLEGFWECLEKILEGFGTLSTVSGQIFENAWYDLNITPALLREASQ